ncbi:MAG TPA: PHP domain-containing protein [Euryarchaeota archaeon]|nr:PHP domain-containing protein [Euryarchaeota archaeon]
MGYLKRSKKNYFYVRVDLHTHTWYSPDGMMPPELLVKIAKKRGLRAVAITDHNRLTFWRDPDILVIPGEEILTSHGEIIGLGLMEEVPRGLSPEETVDRIEEQGGVAVIPHPFDCFRKRTALLLNYNLQSVGRCVVEVLNARYVSWKAYEKALAFAVAKNLPRVGSSDAHTPWEVGNAYTLIQYCDDLDGVLKQIKRGEGVPKGRLSSPIVHIFSPLCCVAHALRIKPL